MHRLVLGAHGAAVAAVAGQQLAGFSNTGKLQGLEQLVDIPTSSTRIPSGLHQGPNKRVLNIGETERFKFIRKWQLQMEDTWDNYEAFKGQPKPKKQFGNEAAEIIWPYALLLENQIHVHRFTKSIYVYYPQRQETADGAFAAAVAKRFSHQYLIPITFHNSQCYVETEMLVEYGEVPWVVVHCLDGKHMILPVKTKAPSSSSPSSRTLESSSASSSEISEDGGQQSHASSSSALLGKSSATGATRHVFSPSDIKSAAEDLLNEVVAAAERLGNAVSDVSAAMTALHDRPIQNQYVRINYQWFGDTQEERSSHLVQWNYDPKKTVPTTKYIDSGVRNRLNYEGRYPVANGSIANAMAQKGRIVKGPGDGTGARSLRSGASSRQNARYSPGAGSSQKF